MSEKAVLIGLITPNVTADLVKEYVSLNKKLIWGSTLAIVFGWVLIFKNDKMTTEAVDKYFLVDDEKYAIEKTKANRILLPGIIMGFGGMLPWIVGVMRQSQNRYEYSVVDGMAEEYNKKLIQEIKGTTP